MATVETIACAVSVIAGLCPAAEGLLLLSSLQALSNVMAESPMSVDLSVLEWLNIIGVKLIVTPSSDRHSDRRCRGKQMASALSVVEFYNLRVFMEEY